MRKIPCVFQRDFSARGNPLILEAVTLGCEWVLAGEGAATRKRDGTACLLRSDLEMGWSLSVLRLLKRYDAKRGKVPPAAFEPSQDPDPLTGHWPGWLPVDVHNPAPEDVWHALGYWMSIGRGSLPDPVESLGGKSELSLELCGPRINGNREQLASYGFYQHGKEDLGIYGPRTFASLRAFLEAFDGEGIVFWREWGNPKSDMAKLTRENFGFAWPLTESR